MIIRKGQKDDFCGYWEPLWTLEKAFNECDANISFYLVLDDVLGKTVRVSVDGDHLIGAVSIEDDNPVQAVKRVAAIVPDFSMRAWLDKEEEA